MCVWLFVLCFSFFAECGNISIVMSFCLVKSIWIVYLWHSIGNEKLLKEQFGIACEHNDGITLERKRRRKKKLLTLLHKVVSSGKFGTRHNNKCTKPNRVHLMTPFSLSAIPNVFVLFLCVRFIVEGKDDKYNFLILINQPPWRMQNL